MIINQVNKAYSVFEMDPWRWLTSFSIKYPYKLYIIIHHNRLHKSSTLVNFPTTILLLLSNTTPITSSRRRHDSGSLNFNINNCRCYWFQCISIIYHHFDILLRKLQLKIDRIYAMINLYYGWRSLKRLLPRLRMELFYMRQWVTPDYREASSHVLSDSDLLRHTHPGNYIYIYIPPLL